MSVSSVSGGAGAGWFNASSALGRSSATSSTYSADGHLFRPNDPLNQHLTAADRTAIKSSTGVDVRADGGILSPMSMSLNDYGAVLMTVGQLASDRANGNGSSLSTIGLAERLKSFGFEGSGSITAAEKSDRLRVDYRA